MTATAPANAGARQARLSVLAGGAGAAAGRRRHVQRGPGRTDIGHGLVLAGKLTKITVAALAAERGGVLGAVYFVNYAGLGVPVIGVGILSLWTGLLTATTVAAVVIATGCVLLIPLVIRQRA